MTSNWITIPKPNARARLRLFCFPYSGASASIYYPWVEILPSAIEVCPVQLPGRGSRISETPYTTLDELIPETEASLKPYLDKPFAFFGHSMGALIGFELSRSLQENGDNLPIILFVSGHNAPHLPDTSEPIHSLPEHEFVTQIKSMNGTPDEILDDPELRDLLIPILRADFSVCETYSYRSNTPLNCSICACGGLGDPYIDREGLKAWRNHTQKEFSLRLFPGNHFYLNDDRIYLLQAIAQEINGVFDLRG